MSKHLANMLTLAILGIVSPTVVSAGGGACEVVVPGGQALLLDDRLMVRMEPDVSVDAFIAAFAADWPMITLATLDAIPGRPIHLLAFDAPAGTNLDAVELALETSYIGTLAWSEWLYTNEAPEGHTGSIFVDGPASASLYAEQYIGGMLGLDAAQTQSTGEGIVVAILDTGLDVDHPALADNVVDVGWNFIAGNGDVADIGDGQDSDGDGNTDEMTGHGTFVAGLIVRVAPATWLLPVRVLDGDGVGDAWTLTQGLFFAIDRGVEVINVSLGSTYDSAGVEDAIDEAAMLGIVTVSAAGNLDRCDPREYPAMKSTGLGVAATDHLDRKAAFSNYNEKIALSAPAATSFVGGEPVATQSIVSTIPGGGYAIWEGTSFAVPLVSGAAAMVRAQHPEWPASLSTCLMLETTIANGAVPIDTINPTYAGMLGAGRLHVGDTVALGPPAPAPGDLDNSGSVDIDDLIRVITDWGLVHSTADLDGDGVVAVGDLVFVIVNWG